MLRSLKPTAKGAAAVRVGPTAAAAPGLGLVRRSVADGVATALLLAVIVGSGVMGERLSHEDKAFTLLANSLATGPGLIALILAFGPLSGAHLNPIVTLAEALRGSLAWAQVPAYLLAQVGGAFLGVTAAHLMFGQSLFSILNAIGRK